MIRVAYPGGAAAHSAAAAERLFPGERELVSLETFSDVVEAAVSGGVAYGVLPIENSLVGPVAETHDLLYDAELSIVAETSIPIRHPLVARAPLAESEIRVIRSHPVALAVDACVRGDRDETSERLRMVSHVMLDHLQAVDRCGALAGDCGFSRRIRLRDL